MRMANVGFSGSVEDRSRLDLLTLFANEHGCDLAKVTESVAYNLPASDFLQDDQHFDVVVLHFLHARKMPQPCPFHGDYLLSTSPLHSPEAWWERLLLTHAPWIFVFGGPAEICSSWIGTLPGYEILVLSNFLGILSLECYRGTF